MLFMNESLNYVDGHYNPRRRFSRAKISASDPNEIMARNCTSGSSEHAVWSIKPPSPANALRDINRNNLFMGLSPNPTTSPFADH